MIELFWLHTECSLVTLEQNNQNEQLVLFELINRHMLTSEISSIKLHNGYYFTL
jgi:hypothetical protein